MIPKAHITAWRARAPWLADAQVEQDLIISRAIVELFRVPEIASSLVFRADSSKRGGSTLRTASTPRTRRR